VQLSQVHLYARQSTHLLIEDDPEAADLLQLALKKAGLRRPLRVLSDGDAAIAYLSSEPPFENPRAESATVPPAAGHEAAAQIGARSPRVAQVPDQYRPLRS
jgi:hypothetical protein